MPVLPPPETATNLEALMRGFDRNTATSRRLIGELLAKDPLSFRDAAVEVLKMPDDSRAFQYLLTVLVSEGLLLAILCHPSLNRAQVLAAARAAQRVDPQADVTIAKSLADGVISYDRWVRPKDAARLLEVLSEISDGSRILPSLLRLLRHPNPHLRSKAVKMIGRGSRSAKWVQNRLAEADPRVRANAIESLWGVDTREARELLQSCVHDTDNRVAGNALVALHRIGDGGVIPEFFHLAGHASPRYRSTAAWAMGESGDPRFAEPLARLLRDASPAVRTRALAGLGRIKAALAKTRGSNPWRVAGMVQDNPLRNLRRLQIVLATDDGSEYPTALATQFAITEDGRPVVAYRVVERPLPEAMSVSFVFPRASTPSAEPWASGALCCSLWKRNSDLWVLQPYIPPEESGGPDLPAEDPPRFTPNLETIEDAFHRVPPRARCGGFWSSILHALRGDHGGSRGKRHVIVFSRSAVVQPPPEELVPAVVNGTQFQVVSTVPNPVIEDVCRRVRGLFQVAGSADEVAGLIRTFYLNLLTRYEIAYTPVSTGCRAIKIRVQTGSGWGEATIPVPGGPPL